MRKYWRSFLIGFQVSFQYRGQIVFKCLRHAVVILMFAVLWVALFRYQNSINGFSLPSIITYYIVVEVIDIIYTSASARFVTKDINSGELNNFLTRPINYWGYYLFNILGRQLAISSFSISLSLILFIFFPKIITTSIGLDYLLLFFLGLGLSFLLYFQIFYVVGMTTFWFSETTHFRQALHQIMGVLGGRWIPLIFFPSILVTGLNFLPFKYLFGHIVKIFQGTISLSDIISAFILEIIWLCIFLIMGKYLWLKGIKKYDAYGY